MRTNASRLLALVSLANLLIACDPAPEGPVAAVDADGDGFDTTEDCDDADASRWDQAGTWEGDFPGHWEGVCDGLCALAVTDDLDIQHRAAEDLAELRCLASVAGYVNIAHNEGLTGLAGLERLEATGNLSVWDNPDLLDLTGLSGLTTPDGHVNIQENPALTTLHGLEQIASVPGTLFLSENASLRDLDGLQGLEEVGGYLSIEDNADLSDLHGLFGLTHVGANVTITGNPSLASAEVEALLDAIDRIDGEVNAQANGG